MVPWGTPGVQFVSGKHILLKQTQIFNIFVVFVQTFNFLATDPCGKYDPGISRFRVMAHMHPSLELNCILYVFVVSVCERMHDHPGLS